MYQTLTCVLLFFQFRFGQSGGAKGPSVSAQEAQAAAILSQARVSPHFYFTFRLPQGSYQLSLDTLTLPGIVAFFEKRCGPRCNMCMHI